MKLENEKALIRTIAEGNTKSFEVLFYSYYPRLKGFICDLLQSPEEAEDISQDIFTTLWQNRTSLDKIDNISAYLFASPRMPYIGTSNETCYSKIISKNKPNLLQM